MCDLALDRDKEGQSKGQHEDVGGVGETITVNGHLVTLALTETELVYNCHCRNLYCCPANVEYRRKDDIPCILTSHTIEEVKAEKDAEECWCHKYASHVVPCVPLAQLASNFIAD